MVAFLPLFAALSTLALQQPPAPRGVAQIPADVPPIITTKSGLKYSVLAPGKEGDHPALGDKVLVHYTCWNLDGSVVDSSRPSGKPLEVEVGSGIIEGWSEALALMTVGAHWKLTVPPELGWGELGSPPSVAPNATTLFEVEVMSFSKGRPLPPFHQGDPAKQQKTESGLVWEALVEGTGSAPKPDDLIEMHVAYWNQDGKLIDCSEKKGKPMTGKASNFALRFLQVAPQYLKVGGRYRFEVPADLCNGMRFGTPLLPTGSKTIWELELLRIVDLSYVKPDPTKQTTTASGLKYQVLHEGTGVQPKLGDLCAVNFFGWLAADGKLFDTNLKSGDVLRASLVPGKLIPGWIEGLPLMKEGATYLFEVPAALAWGDKGSPADKSGAQMVPPKATVVFQIELVKVSAR